MSLPFWISAFSAIVSGAFALSVWRRWTARRSKHLLAWSIGLTCFFASTFSQTVLALVWSPALFKVWYWAGAIAVAPWLGQGTAFLLARRSNIARYLWAILGVLSVMTAFWVAITPLDGSAWQAGRDMTTLFQAILPEGGVRVFVPMMNGWGTVLLFGGALYSGYLFRRKAIMPERVLGNWCIALGAIFPAVTGLLIRAGYPEYKYLGDLLGLCLIYAGYLFATRQAAWLSHPLLALLPGALIQSGARSPRPPAP